MTQEHKDLLLKDLCARLPYGVICEDIYGNALELNSIDKPNTATFKCSDNTFWTTDLDKCKPYLFPLSSMTEEQKEESHNKLIELELKAISDEISSIEPVKFEIDFYHKHHLDYRGLIPMGLAIDATGLNIY
jgi:hypothetical protein